MSKSIIFLSAGVTLHMGKAANPAIYDEVQSRYGEKKIYGESLSNIWPEAKARLLKDRNEADLSDLTGDAQADYDVPAGRKPKRDRRAIPQR